jgi:hypothetical protein
VFQSTIDKNLGKVTVSGLMDPYAVIKKLNKAHKRAQLWGPPNPEVASEVQKPQLGNGGRGMPNGADGASSSGGGGGDAGEDEEMVMPPPPQQLPQQLQQQMEMKGVKLPPQLMGMGGKMPMPAAAPPAKGKAVRFDVPDGEQPGEDSDSDDVLDNGGFVDEGLDDGEDDDAAAAAAAAKMMMRPMAIMPPATGRGGKKGGKIPVQIQGNDDIDDMIAASIRAKQNQGGASSSGMNGGGAQAPQNGKGSAPGGGNKPGKGKKVVAAGGPPAGVVGGPMMGGMPPQPPQPAAGMMMRPPNMTGGRPMGGMPMGYPQNGGVGMQPGGGNAGVHGNGMMPGAGLYPGGMAPAPEMMVPQAAWNNPVAQQQPHMMMNGDGNYVHGSAGGYPPMGYGYGYGYGRQPAMAYTPPPMYHHPPAPHPSDNMFSDENPNSCSVM